MDLSKAYHLLDIPAGSAEKDVRTAYRDMVAVWHPDRFQGNERLRKSAEHKIRDINAAFQLISSAGFPTSIASAQAPVRVPRKQDPPAPKVHEVRNPPARETYSPKPPQEKAQASNSSEELPKICPKCNSPLKPITVIGDGKHAANTKTAVVCDKCRLFSLPSDVRKCAACGKGGFRDAMAHEMPLGGEDKPWVDVEPETKYWHTECVPRGICPVCGKIVKGECMTVGRTLVRNGGISSDQTKHLKDGEHWEHGVDVHYYHRECRPDTPPTTDVRRHRRGVSGSPSKIGHLCHIAAFLGVPLPVLGLLLGPLLIWLLKRKSHRYIDRQGKEAVLFQVNIMLAIGLILGLMMVQKLGMILGLSIIGAISIYDLARAYQAASAAYNMEPYQYPFIIRFIK